MSGLLSLLVLGLFLIMRKRKKLKKWWLIVPMVAIGSCAFANTTWGAWVTSVLANLLSWPASWFAGATTPMVGAVVMILLLAIVIYDIGHDRKADKMALIGLALLPMIFVIASGPVANGGTKFTDAVAGFGVNGFSYLVAG